MWIGPRGAVAESFAVKVSVTSPPGERPTFASAGFVVASHRSVLPTIVPPCPADTGVRNGSSWSVTTTLVAHVVPVFFTTSA